MGGARSSIGETKDHNGPKERMEGIALNETVASPKPEAMNPSLGALGNARAARAAKPAATRA